MIVEQMSCDIIIHCPPLMDGILKAKHYCIMQKKKKNENERIIIRNTFMPIIEKYPFSKNNNFVT